MGSRVCGGMLGALVTLFLLSGIAQADGLPPPKPRACSPHFIPCIPRRPPLPPWVQVSQEPVSVHYITGGEPVASRDSQKPISGSPGDNDETSPLVVPSSLYGPHFEGGIGYGGKGRVSTFGLFASIAHPKVYFGVRLRESETINQGPVSLHLDLDADLDDLEGRMEDAVEEKLGVDADIDLSGVEIKPTIEGRAVTKTHDITAVAGFRIFQVNPYFLMLRLYGEVEVGKYIAIQRIKNNGTTVVRDIEDPTQIGLGLAAVVGVDVGRWVSWLPVELMAKGHATGLLRGPSIIDDGENNLTGYLSATGGISGYF